ncbi:gag protease polyprotein [Cucumis melo var. makuwa]|uniref:Gag protease polyprotein n=1 Tax=Cucumis melo var. makuwa TaxID=1194695 RepID=A0A5A7V3S4_CUCMM|nr:gag protease polyprotein [Cucumis melo var. makuwa]
MKCPEDQKVQCAIFMLTDRGTAWWETTERMLGGDVSQITWQQFKESFYAKFFSASLRDAKRQEFLNLEQGDMTVEQYDAKFDMLSRFAPEMIATEAARADKFVRSLRLDIQGLVRAFRPATHADALRLAVDLSLQERANSSKTAGRGSTSGQKRKAEQQPVPVPQRNFRSADRCPLRLTGNAQNQGAGAPHQGRVFATNKTEAERAGTVVTGTLPVLGHYALVLFDSGPSHFFISSAFMLHARLEVEPLHHVLSVSTPSGECMLSKEKVKACQIEIAGHVIEVTLLVLDMLDFDVILGMDWLAANHASIDCSRKEVTFNPPSMASFKFKGGGSRSLPQVISAIKASKLLSQGTWGILASVVDTREVDVSLSSEPVVRDYPDVFLEELPGLPPHREVEFAIELEPRTVPISRAPYRMAPAELKELKHTWMSETIQAPVNRATDYVGTHLIMRVIAGVRLKMAWIEWKIGLTKAEMVGHAPLKEVAARIDGLHNLQGRIGSYAAPHNMEMNGLWKKLWNEAVTSDDAVDASTVTTYYENW